MGWTVNGSKATTDAILAWLEHPAIDTWIPPSAHHTSQPQDLLRMRIVAAVLHGLALLALMFGVLDAMSGWYELSAMGFGALPLAGLALWRLRRGASLDEVAIIASATTFIVLVCNASLNGGVEAPALYFLPLVPIVPLTVDSPRLAGAWVVVSALTVGFARFVEGPLGYNFPQAMPDSDLPLNRTIVITAACAFVYGAFLMNLAFGGWMRTRMLEAEAARFDRILDAAGDAIVRLDATGVISTGNVAARRLFQEPDLAGKPIGHFLPQFSLLEHAAGAIVLSASSRGDTMPVEATCTAIHDGRVLVIRDIRDRVRAQEVLQQALDEAKAANIAKSRFLASMSHELRTPLNAVIGYAELISEDIQSGSPPRDTGDLDHIVGSARHLLALIDQVLDLAKVEAGKMEVERRRVPLVSFFDELATVGRTLARSRSNQWRASLPTEHVTVLLDEVRTRQIALNLLSNAAKFCEEGTITLDAMYDGERLTVTVSDTGIGMTPAQLASVWDEFSQAEASTQRVYGGTGLGLALARRLTALLGGAIDATSEPGAGTSFRVELPVPRA
jgi:signal transduction histidine kinase